ncbi:TetR/AcrR family transcriptional regulator [Acrocarpospora sp. B8E8]|uniref:TetR/AcrR family transcriptional regulator n=1 Tax=Acrocarpospora sp. B8E8 TaxID=3153572 RepID=UPI00325E3D86
MSGNEDRRVRRTRQTIQRAMVELMLDKGYDKVTVTDIIDRADVGRSTFYAHFTDKRDVLFSNLGELDFLRPSPQGEGPLFSFGLAMFEHVAEQGPLVRALLGSKGGGVVMARAEQILAAVVRAELQARGAIASARLDLVVTGVVGAFMAMLRGWLDGEVTATPAELDTAFRAFVTPGAESFLAQAG